MLAVMAMKIDRAFEIPNGLRQLFCSLLRNSIVAVREMDISQSVLPSQFQVRRGTVDADDSLDAKSMQLLKRGFTIRLASRDHLCVNLNGIWQM